MYAKPTLRAFDLASDAACCNSGTRSCNAPPANDTPPPPSGPACYFELGNLVIYGGVACLVS